MQMDHKAQLCPPLPGAETHKRRRVDHSADMNRDEWQCFFLDCASDVRPIDVATDMALDTLISLSPDHDKYDDTIKEVLDWAVHDTNTVSKSIIHLQEHVQRKVQNSPKTRVDLSNRLTKEWAQRMLLRLAEGLDGSDTSLCSKHACFTTMPTSGRYKLELKITPIFSVDESNSENEIIEQNTADINSVDTGTNVGDRRDSGIVIDLVDSSDGSSTEASTDDDSSDEYSSDEEDVSVVEISFNAMAAQTISTRSRRSVFVFKHSHVDLRRRAIWHSILSIFEQHQIARLKAALDKPNYTALVLELYEPVDFEQFECPLALEFGDTIYAKFRTPRSFAGTFCPVCREEAHEPQLCPELAIVRR